MTRVHRSQVSPVRLLLSWVAPLVLTAACVEDTPLEADDAGPVAPCTAGRDLSCPCPGGVLGIQTCNARGTFDPCVCPQPDAGFDAKMLDGETPDGTIGPDDVGSPDVRVAPRDVQPPDAAAPELPPQCARVYGAVDRLGAADVTYIATLLPYSGPLDAFGAGMERGVELAAETVESMTRVAVVSCDSATDPNVARRAIEALAALGVPAIIGPAASSTTLGAFDAARRDGVLLISPSATSPVIAQVEDDDLLWRTAPNDARQGIALGRHALELRPARVAVVHRDDPYGEGIADAFAAEACAELECTRFTVDEVASVADVDPELVVLVTFLDDGVTVLDQLAPLGDVPILVAEGLRREQVIDRVVDPGVLRRVIGVGSAPPSGPAHDTFAAAHQRRFGEPPAVFAAHAYDAYIVLARALDQLDDRADIAAALRAVDHDDGVSGPLDFDETGEAPHDIEAWQFNVDGRSIESLGVILTADGEYW